VATVPLSEFDALARAIAGDRHDPYSQRALARAYEEYGSRTRPPIAPFVLTADGHEFPNLPALLADPSVRFATGEVRLEPVPPGGPAWRFSLPFERLVFLEDGAVEVHPLEPGPPVRGIARVLLREHYLVRSEADERRTSAGGPRIELRGLRGTVADAVRACRAERIVPFSVAILVYLAAERVRYEFDATQATLLPDPRAGRLPPARRAHRSSRLSWALDGYVARSDLSPLGVRCLEVLVESPGLTSIEVSHVFGGVRELVDSALQGLVQHRLVTFDHRTGLYRARLEAFETVAGGTSARADAGASATDPSLRTSVQELLAAADARATCPLCGAPLPPGPKTILCANCAARVGAA
jgi:hypothetical protein